MLDPAYMMDAKQTGEIPNIAEAAISGFVELGPDEFMVVVTAYDCLDDEVIDSDEVLMNGVLQSPKVGTISILGVAVSQTDYLITGLVVFVFAAGLDVFLFDRRKKSNR